MEVSELKLLSVDGRLFKHFQLISFFIAYYLPTHAPDKIKKNTLINKTLSPTNNHDVSSFIGRLAG
jgi:hypothetical protein